MKQGYSNVQITDTFPIWEDDGISKKSGESSFTVTFWRDGVVVAPGYTIAEIANGEYSIAFTPTAAGLWSVEVVINYNDEAWGAQYDISKPPIQMQFSAADNNTNATFAVWGDLNGERVTDMDSVSAIVRDPDGTQVVDLGTDAAPTADGVFEFSTLSSNLSSSAEYYLDITATRGGESWYPNLGFAKV